jgi:hypothetical protein
VIRAYIVKRIEPEDSRVYVFRDKHRAKAFINKAIAREGGVWLELIYEFDSDEEARAFFDKCRQLSNFTVQI